MVSMLFSSEVMVSMLASSEVMVSMLASSEVDIGSGPMTIRLVFVATPHLTPAC
jgi:hypothetical protein